MIVVIPRSSSNPFRRDGIDVFRVEGIPLNVHVDDSTRNLFVEFASSVQQLHLNAEPSFCHLEHSFLVKKVMAS